jgi:[ribosomal protein S5]-alanine N-acetyltransferase
MLQHFKDKRILSHRLIISPIVVQDATFVIQLFNTSGWLKYIGDRNIHTITAAEDFILNANTNSNAAIWTICINEKPTLPLGIITLIKRAYLAYPDVGYALLPNAMNLGYAKEATQAVIEEIKAANFLAQIHAITLEENVPSLNLLSKLHFSFDKQISEQNEVLQVYKLELKKSSF